MKIVTSAARAVFALSLLATALPAHAQTPAPAPAAVPVSGGPVDAAKMQDLVIANRVLTDLNVIDGFGHVSMRHPTNPNRYLMGRNLAPALVVADDIMEYDLDSNAVDAKGRASFNERFIHGEIYKARPDVMAVVHTHSPGVIPFSVSSVGLKPMFHLGAFLSPERAGVRDPRYRRPEQHAGEQCATRQGAGDDPRRSQRRADARPWQRRRRRHHPDGGVPRALQQRQCAAADAGDRSSAVRSTYMEPEESQKTLGVIESIHGRAWDLWKRAAMEKMSAK